MPGVHVRCIQVGMTEIIRVPSPRNVLVDHDVEVVNAYVQSRQLVDGSDGNRQVLGIRVGQRRVGLISYAYRQLVNVVVEPASNVDGVFEIGRRDETQFAV